MGRPVQGHDVSCAVMGPNGPELAGEWQEVDINISNDAETYQETNSRMPIYLDGDITIDGTLKRGWMDMNIVATTVGTGNLQPGQYIPPSPRFVITCTIDAPDKGLSGRYQLTGVLMDKTAIAIKSGKSVVDSNITFKAEGLIEAAS
ncbi:hypothetical protein [Alicyclobacillus fastidiosus]|uniref:Lipid/polyisoprenoid-binding YceI-like domain-containing protein n=1 Tax=Alicyclobacillus fastidiosus TaxID=392011 RepID=A0ABV5AKL2_9BACL|nr:hypothetical protein [Alicyclobacillus fastidiosus]WEH08184.1 hypothetical protein PYS47_15875 [Alicyclobacillus fastidiosus]